MKKCPYCAEQIQDEAIYCRFCNHDLTKPIPASTEPVPPPIPEPLPRPGTQPADNRAAPAITTQIMAILIVIIIGLCLFGYATGSFGKSVPAPAAINPTSTIDKPSALEAEYMCEKFVKDQLKAPSTAKFQFWTDAAITQSGNEFTVRSYVDSQNSFGAQIRTQFKCVVFYTGSQNWKLISLDTVP